MAHYQHIIWDWNGTLLNDVATCFTILNHILKKHQKSPVNLDFYREHFDFPVINFYEKLGFDFAQEEYSQIADDYISLYRHEQFYCSLHIGAETILKTCQLQGRTQSILSAYHENLLQDVVDHFGIATHFSHIRGLNDFHATSKIEVGKALLENLAIAPSDIILIGDTTHDYAVAQSLGIDCMLISKGHQHHHRLAKLGIPTLTSIQDVPNALK